MRYQKPNAWPLTRVGSREPRRSQAVAQAFVGSRERELTRGARDLDIHKYPYYRESSINLQRFNAETEGYLKKKSMRRSRK